MVAFLLLFAFANIVGARVAYARYWHGSQSPVYGLPRLDEPARGDLPAEIDSWNLVEFEHIHRGHEALQAQDSYVWHYTNGRHRALVSIDCPWSDWHNLDWCYSALGWETNPTFMITDPEDVGDRMHSEILMKDGRMRGFVAFSSVDRNGAEVLPPVEFRAETAGGFVKQLVGNVANSLALTPESRAQLRGVALPANTIQLLCIDGDDFNKRDIRDLRELFSKSRDFVLKAPRYAKPDTNSSTTLAVASK